MHHKYFDPSHIKWHLAPRRYLGNIAANPGEDKFRSIKLTNAAFQSRVAAVPGTVDFLTTCGFEVRAMGHRAHRTTAAQGRARARRRVCSTLIRINPSGAVVVQHVKVGAGLLLLPMPIGTAKSAGEGSTRIRSNSAGGCCFGSVDVP